jgi:hypothetical protein
MLHVLLAGDVIRAGCAVALAVDLEHREVRHETVRGGAVPVLFIGLEEHAIMVVDLDTGKVRRLLEDHASTKVEPGVEQVTGERAAVDVSQRQGAPGEHRWNRDRPPARVRVLQGVRRPDPLPRARRRAAQRVAASGALGERVERVAETDLTDGPEFDAQGNLYLTSLEGNAITVLRPDGRTELVARSTDFQWPDTIAIGPDGDLHRSNARFHLLPDFINEGEDKRTPPYKVFRLKLP